MVATNWYLTNSDRQDIEANAKGSIDTGAFTVGLQGEFKKLKNLCTSTSDTQITYYATDLPNELPTDMDKLIEVINGFISRVNAMEGLGVPLEVNT